MKSPVEIFCADHPPVVWREAGDCPFDVTATSDVWKLPLSPNHNLAPRQFTLLNADEQARASKYRREVDAKRYIISRAALKLLLTRYTKQSLQTIWLAYGEDRKPYLNTGAGLGLYFNVAHSGDFALIAFSKQDIGVDIEHMQPELNYLEVLENYFSEPEIRQIKASPEPLHDFYKFWTRKEALLKATGRGIIDELQQMTVLNGPNKLNGDLINTACNWLISSFTPINDYLASVAACHDVFSFFNCELEELNPH